MTDVRFKIGESRARAAIKALMDIAPWYSRKALEGMWERVTPTGIEVVVKHISRRRTSDQNAYYWLCIGIFAKAVGMTPDEAHDAILCEHHGSNEVQIGSRLHHVPKGRSSNLGTADFSALIETLQRTAAFAGCVLPEPQTMEAM